MTGERRVDLGDGHSYEKVLSKGEWVAIIEFHSDAKTGDPCGGFVAFEGYDSREDKWRVLSWDPLTLNPSLQCPCGSHGFIRNGRWEPA